MCKKILLICGSLNQTTMMHKIANQLGEFDCVFTPFYAVGFLGLLSRLGLLNFTILGGRHRQKTEDYLLQNKLKIDFGGMSDKYDLIFIGTDTYIPKNILGETIILVQEGIIEPEGWMFRIVKRFNLPRFLANTSMTGLSHVYDLFCVASEGYRQLFIKKGIDPQKIIVTGIPNFDNAASFKNNTFPLRDFVLVATSSTRETFQKDNRIDFIKNARKLALEKNKQLVFKLHPNENTKRSKREISKYAPEAVIFENESLECMIANCDIFITQYTSAVFIGLALGKTVYSYMNLDELRVLTPIQNGGRSSALIADISRQLIHEKQANYSFTGNTDSKRKGKRVLNLS